MPPWCDFYHGDTKSDTENHREKPPCPQNREHKEVPASTFRQTIPARSSHLFSRKKNLSQFLHSFQQFCGLNILKPVAMKIFSLYFSDQGQIMVLNLNPQSHE
jgi:hypothetical protein